MASICASGSRAAGTDTLGLLLNVVVHPADVQDRDGAFQLLRRARRLFPFIERIFADGGYAGEKMALVVWRTGAWKLEIVKRSNASGFEVLPKRWIVTVCTMLPN
jgi:transposase